jgi:hypothetical protein
MIDGNGRRIRGPLKRTGKGVYWRASRGCWQARITVVTRDKQEKNIHLGHFDKESNALKARAKAEMNLEKDPYFYDPPTP